MNVATRRGMEELPHLDRKSGLNPSWIVLENLKYLTSRAVESIKDGRSASRGGIRPKFGAGVDAGQSLPPTSHGANKTTSTGGRTRLTHGDLGVSSAGSEQLG